MVDVNSHELVPEHRLLDDPGEIEEVLEEYNVKKTDLPKIQHDPDSNRKGEQDMALADLDERVEPGDVVEIVRDSRTTERAVVYRLVVEP